MEHQLPTTLSSLVDDPRVTVRRAGMPDPEGRAVVCWMQRAQRATDNPALEAAIAVANLLGRPVVALFVLDPRFPSANLRHFQFLVQGLAELPAALGRRGVGFEVRIADGTGADVVRFCDEVRAALVVGDENPLRAPEAWRRRVADDLRVPFWTVDSDVVVPTVLLHKERSSAGTIRPRIHRQLEWCLRPVRARVPVVRWRRPPRLRKPGAISSPASTAALLGLLDDLPIDRSVLAVPDLEGGRQPALALLRRFIQGRLRGYAASRNRPEVDGTSRLSPYLHFGQIGPRELALVVRDADAPGADCHAFLEQLIVRRELAVNFVRYNPRYDRLGGRRPGPPARSRGTATTSARTPTPSGSSTWPTRTIRCGTPPSAK